MDGLDYWMAPSNSDTAMQLTALTPTLWRMDSRGSQVQLIFIAQATLPNLKSMPKFVRSGEFHGMTYILPAADLTISSGDHHP